MGCRFWVSSTLVQQIIDGVAGMATGGTDVQMQGTAHLTYRRNSLRRQPRLRKLSAGATLNGGAVEWSAFRRPDTNASVLIARVADDVPLLFKQRLPAGTPAYIIYSVKCSLKYRVGQSPDERHYDSQVQRGRLGVDLSPMTQYSMKNTGISFRQDPADFSMAANVPEQDFCMRAVVLLNHYGHSPTTPPPCLSFGNQGCDSTMDGPAAYWSDTS
ncbi:hypothetical protein JB92DRAFT_2835439 [Gautieria morchelliformis]|nr:hypothetical protein JB92DRAFT_2835439 [Gautieria morchelliformis]